MGSKHVASFKMNGSAPGPLGNYRLSPHYDRKSVPSGGEYMYKTSYKKVNMAVKITIFYHLSPDHNEHKKKVAKSVHLFS